MHSENDTLRVGCLAEPVLVGIHADELTAVVEVQSVYSICSTHTHMYT